MKISVTQPVILFIAIILLLRGYESTGDSTHNVRGRRAATTDPCGVDCNAQNHKVCNEIGLDLFECECTNDHFESKLSGNCLTVADKLAEMANRTGSDVSSYIVAVTPKPFPMVDVSFQNDHDGFETTLKLIYTGIELWSDSCKGPACHIADTIMGLTLDCEKMSLVVSRGTAKSSPTFLSTPSMFNVTFDGIPVLDETTIFDGVATREVKRINTGTYKFTNCGVTTKPTKPANVTNPVVKPISPTINVRFTNDNAGREARLTLIHQGVEVWTDSCTTIECEIAAQNITVDSCNGTSLWLESRNSSSARISSNATGEDYVYLSPSVLVAAFDGVTVVAEKANVSTGLYEFDCTNAKEPIVQVEANATQVNQTSAVNETLIEVYFQNDHTGANATLSVFHNGTELWSDSCSGSECVISSDNITDTMLDCKDFNILLTNKHKTSKSISSFFLTPSVLNVMYNGLIVVDETTLVTGVTTKDVKKIQVGWYKFNCGVAKKAS